MTDWRAYWQSYRGAWTRLSNYVNTNYHATWAYLHIQCNRYNGC